MRYIIAIPALICILFSSTFAQLPEGWEWQNPLPHGLTIYDIVMLDEWYAVAGCESGYIMRSGDGGQTWSQMHVTNGDVMDICMTASGKLWAATRNGALLYSSDYGASWETRIDANVSSYGYASVHMIDDVHGLAILPQQKVYRTSDGGQTWSVLPNMYVSSDNGQWVTAQSLSTWYILGVLGSTPRLYVSTNFGETWAIDTVYNTQVLNRLVFLDSSYGFLCRDGGLLRTIDGGATWEEMDIYGFGYTMDVAAGERMGDNLFALSIGSVVVNASTDNGTTWNMSLLENAFGSGSASAMSFGSKNIGLVAGNGGRILRTTDGGLSWNIVHGIGFLGTMQDIVFMTPEQGIALTASPTVLLSSNGGDRWIETTPVGEYNLQEVSMYSETSGYAYGTEDSEHFSLFHTSDAGVTWENRGILYNDTEDSYYIFPQAILADSPDRVFVGLSYGRVFRSTDGGATYDSLLISSTLRNLYSTSVALYSFEPDHIVLVSQSGVSHSTDGGDKWVYYNLPMNRWIAEAVFLSPTKGYAIMNRYFGTTTDGGISWNTTQMSDIDLIHFFDENNGVLYREEMPSDLSSGSVLWTHDGGNTWDEHPLRERITWRGWYWESMQQGWVYGWEGMIRHSESSGIVGTEQPVSLAQELYIGSNYPNPVQLSLHGGTSFRCVVPGTVPVPVSAYVTGILGRRHTEVLTTELQPGSTLLTLNAAMLQSVPKNQPVFLVVQTPGKTYTKKFLVLD